MSTTRDAGAGVRFRVVVVDDDFHVARLHTRIVESVEGFGVVATAGTAAQAAAVIDAEQPDLVLADIYLPDGSGLDLIAGRDVDAVVLSAAVATAAVRKALQRGAFGYLIKPFADDDLTELLRAYGRYRNLVDSQAELDQEAVDRARRVLHGAGSRDGASRRSPTETAVLGALAEAGAALSAPMVADRVGVSRATAQRYLSTLAHQGHLVVELRYGSTGRPEHRYRTAGRT
ncbi:response regulator [Promicromonospora sukumoe]|uniref:response regulator n=1 Tax=Promicromonospora sukumoe TaxID=88382 RepID=UPI000379C8AA|nr:response regulator [Promicromonospora sukumoe]